MSATAVDPILIPVPLIHKRFHEKTKGMSVVKFQFVEKLPESFRFTATLDQIFQPIAASITEETSPTG